MPTNKPDLQRIIQKTPATKIVQTVIPQSLGRNDKIGIMTDFQKSVDRMILKGEVVLVTLQVTG